MPSPYGETRSQKICSIQYTVVICFIVSISMLLLALGLTYYSVPDTPAKVLDKLDNDLWITMNVDQMWENFKSRFNKSYGEDGERKFETFKVNLRTYLDAGRKNPLALLSFTKFSDLNESAGELLDLTGLDGDVQEPEMMSDELAAAIERRNQASVGAPQDKGGGGGATPFTTARRGTPLWDVFKEKPLSAFKIPQRHGHAWRVKNAIRRATKDPYSVVPLGKNNKRDAGRRASQLQTDDNGVGPTNIWVSGFCNTGNNLLADGLYTREGLLPNGYPYYKHIAERGRPYYLFYDEECSSGRGGEWRLARQPVNPNKVKQVIEYGANARGCVAARSNVQLFKPEKRINAPRSPHEGTKLWRYRGQCTGNRWRKRRITMLHDSNTWSWQFEGKVSPVKHQGSCGSCWAFAGVAAIESAWLIGAGTGGNKLEPLSEQAFLDCEDDYKGCRGGNFPKAFTKTVEENAARWGHSAYGGGVIPIADNYKNRGKKGGSRCRMNSNRKIGAVVNSVQRPLIGVLNQYGGGDHDRAPNDQILQAALQTGGPIFAAVYTNGHKGWMGYNGGIMTNCEVPPNKYQPHADRYFGDHAVVIVGFGLDTTRGQNMPYWILKNSWGADWGEGGFARVAKGADPPCVYSPYLYTAADPVECPIAKEMAGKRRWGKIIRRQRAVFETCHAMCCADLACEGFHYDVNGAGTHKSCLLRTAIDTERERPPAGDTVDTLFVLQSDLRAETRCEPFEFSNHPMAALNGEEFKPGLLDQIVGGRATYWSDNFYMYWCREQASWHIAYRATYAQNLEPGQCNAIARKADPSHFSTEGGWWYYNSAASWWEATPNVQISCGACNTFVLKNVAGLPNDNFLGGRWRANYRKMVNGQPTYWNKRNRRRPATHFMWYAPSCVSGGWFVDARANYPPGSKCGGYAFTSFSAKGSVPYVSRKWHSQYAQGLTGLWYDESQAFDMEAVCTGRAKPTKNEYCASCEGRNLNLPGVVTAPARQEAATSRDVMPAERRSLPAQVDLPCDQFSMTGFTTSELDGHMWYREDSKQVSGQPTWWTADLASGVRYYIFYCPASTEWRITNEEKWAQHANYNPNCSPYKIATATTLPAASGNLSFTETEAEAVVDILADCTRCKIHDVHGFDNPSINDFYHEVASKTVGGASTYWHPNGHWFMYQCKMTGAVNENRWILASQSSWAAASAGTSCEGIIRHASPGAYTPVGSVSDSVVSWEGADNASGVSCHATGFCPYVEVRGILDETWGSNGWYERDTEKTAGDQPTYWMQDESWFMYYCSSLNVWHLRPGTDWDTDVSNGNCMPETEENRLRGVLAGADHFAYPRTGNWQLYKDGSWQTQNTGSNMMTVACRYLDAFKIDGFTSTVANAHYLRRDTHYKNNMPTFWSDDHQVFAYYCPQEERWAVATGSQWPHIKMAGSSCDSIAFKEGSLTRPMDGEANWTEYTSGAMSPVAHKITVGDCNRTIMSGFRQNNLNQVFQKWEGRYTITGMPSYYSPAVQFQVMYWCISANRWYVTQYTEAGAQAVIADEALQASCPHTARKNDNSPILSSGGWEEKCTPGQLVMRDGAHGNFSKVCDGSPLNDNWNNLGTQATPQDCLNSCQSTTGCEYAVFNRETKTCAQFASCPSDTLATSSSPYAIIAVCPASGYTTTSSADPACEESSDIRITEQGCRCQKMWAYDNVDVTNYCGIPDPQVEHRQWCFVIDSKCQGSSWGYCLPASVPSQVSDANGTGTRATPAPPHVAVVDSVRQEIVDVRANLNENLPETCCEGKFNFSQNAGDAATITENGMNIDVKMHIMADGTVLSDDEADLIKTLAAALLVSDTRVKLTSITQGTFMRRFAELEDAEDAEPLQYTVQFYVRNTSGGPSDGLQGWHIALIALVSVVVGMAVVVVVMLGMFSSEPDESSSGLVKADIRDLEELDGESESEMRTPSAGGRGGQVGRNREIMRLARAGGLKGGYDPFEHRPLADGSRCPLESSRTDASLYAENLDYCPCCGGGKKQFDDGDCKSARSEEDKQENLWDNLRSGNRLRGAYEKLISFRMKQLLKKHLRGGREARRGPDIDYEDMAVVVRDGLSGSKVVLQQCNGSIQSGRATAIMGPSGAGKTSFLHALAGRVSFVGKVKANGHEKTRPELRKLVGFVPQNDDSLLGDMTVKENIEHHARIRSADRTDDEVDDATASMINLLSLATCQDTEVGTAEKRGVSGGQKKRACIGAELVAEPSVLFLDEPTSGLDTHSSMLVCNLLKNLAEFSGVTIVASIHQPSAAILRQFHNLILLAPGTRDNPGGRLAYAGPNKVALTYFDRVIGIPCTSLAENDASSFYMLALSGQLERGCHVGKDGEKQWRAIKSMELEARWAACATDGNSAIFSQSTAGEFEVDVTEEQKRENPIPHALAPWVLQLLLFFNRFVVRNFRLWKERAIDSALFAIAGCYTGLLFVGQEYMSPECMPPCDLTALDDVVSGVNEGRSTARIKEFLELAVDPFATQAGFVVLGVSICAAVADLRVFNSVRHVYKQEAGTGLSSTAFFLAMDVANFLWIAMCPLAFIVPYWLWVNQAGIACAPFWGYYEVILPLSFTASGLAYLVSTVVPSSNSQLAVVVIILVSLRLYDIRDLQWLRYFTFMRWAQEAFYLEDYICLTERARDSHGTFKVGLPAKQAQSTTTPWDPEGFPEAIAWLWGWGLFFRFCAWLNLNVQQFMGSDW